MFKTMDELCGAIQGRFECSIHGSGVLALTDALRVLRENYEMVAGIGFAKPNQRPSADYTFYERGGCHEGGWQEHEKYRQYVLVPKSAQKPDLREAADLARSFIRAWWNEGVQKQDVDSVLSALDGALDDSDC